jgi:hypothetical protein
VFGSIESDIRRFVLERYTQEPIRPSTFGADMQHEIPLKFVHHFRR